MYYPEHHSSPRCAAEQTLLRIMVWTSAEVPPTPDAPHLQKVRVRADTTIVLNQVLESRSGCHVLSSPLHSCLNSHNYASKPSLIILTWNKSVPEVNALYLL